MTAAPVLARSLKFAVTISRGEGMGKVYSFEKPIVTIGRGPENDLVFANDPKISRSHAEFRVQVGQLYIRNLSDKNFILVNGERVDQKIVFGSAQIQVGETILMVQIEKPASSPNKMVLAHPSSPANSAVGSTASSAASSISFQNPSMINYGNQPKVDPIYSSEQRDFSGGGRTAVKAPGGLLSNPRVRFYLIIALVGIFVWWLMNEGNGPKKQEINLRTEGDVVRAIEDSANAVRELKKQQQNSGQDSLQYKSAQEQYIKGFRDYRQGQYARAIESFQAALSLYPQHELARKYLLQSRRKFENAIDLSMSQGRKYYQKQNYKMCQSSFAHAIFMLRDSTKPKYQEAKQLYDECRLRAEGRF